MDNNKLNYKRQKKAKLVARLLAATPFIRCIILNGSLAQNKSKPSSDIDFLIIAKNGRIFTVRFFSLLIVSFLGLKRPRDPRKSHSGKFCLNYFMTENHLSIPHNRLKSMNIYCAQNYSQSVLLWGNEQIFEKYLKLNFRWMKKYITPKKNELNLKVGTPLVFFHHGLELILFGPIGNILERFLKKIQVLKISADPESAKYPDLIVFNDNELRFHPPKPIKKSKF